LARGVVALGEALELQLIAEGVESSVQRRELRMLGCHLAQGYLFSQAIPATKVVTWASAQVTHQVVATGQRRMGVGQGFDRMPSR
jgi:EAL domain-containing protein (putative c-di-GMP-specific phosphodiesterase class I)